MDDQFLSPQANDFLIITLFNQTSASSRFRFFVFAFLFSPFVRTSEVYYRMDSDRDFFGPLFSHHNMLSLGNLDMFLQERPAANMAMFPRKRSFLDAADMVFEDEHMFEKKSRLTSEQVNLLEKSFEEENKLEPERKMQLAKELRLRPRQVAVWFQNRKARWKTQQLERDYVLLKSSYGSLLSNYETVLKENQKLKSQVASMTLELRTDSATAEQTSDQDSEYFRTERTTDAPDVRFNMELDERLGICGIRSTVADEDCFSDVYEAANQDEEPFRLWVWS